MDEQSKTTKKERNFKSLLIEPFKQIKFGLYVIGLSFVFLVICALLFVNSFQEQYQNVMEIFQIADPNNQHQIILNDVFYKNAFRLCVFFAVFFVAMFYTVFKLTHRYYGPLVSIERFLDQLIAGNYDAKLTIRTKDELQDLTGKLNELAVVLRAKHMTGANAKESGSSKDKKP